jgi:outer membrane lipoprotein SlyB
MIMSTIRKSRFTALAATAAAVTLMAGCASPGYNQSGQAYPTQQNYSSGQAYGTMYGVVDSIQVVERNTNNGPGLGTVAGALLGGVLGNQVGSGNGRTVATVAGAVGGGVVGNRLENNQRGNEPGLYQIGIRLDNGSYTTVTQDSAADLGIGNRVRIDNGRVYRY